MVSDTTSSRLPITPASDRYGRQVADLRLSVTDRCNLRCVYCIPEETPVFQPRSELLSFEEIERLTRVFVTLGVRKLRLTGGEPLLRRDLHELVSRLHAVAGVADLAMTTNGILLSRQAEALLRAGLQRVTISLDTLRADRFQQMTRRAGVESVIEAIQAAQASPWAPVKVNVVMMRGFNDDEIVDFGRFARDTGAIVRFIEFMPLEAGDVWSREMLVPGEQVRATLAAWKPLEPMDSTHPAETARRFRFADGRGQIGIIAPVTQAFCGQCNRARLTAEGFLRTCLFAHDEVNLKAPLRAGATDSELASLIRDAWHRKEPGHLINSPDYRRPTRTMSAIGG